METAPSQRSPSNTGAYGEKGPNYWIQVTVVPLKAFTAWVQQ